MSNLLIVGFWGVKGQKRCPPQTQVKRQNKKLSPERELRPGSAWWCGKRDLNPYVKDTRPSNVPVCQFQHCRRQHI